MRGLEQELEVRVHAGGATLDGSLAIPQNPRGIVMFAHGSGSSRYSPRNRYVAETLRQRSFGTLLLDLLTPDEEQIDDRTRQWRFDIELLADRLAGAAAWLDSYAETRQLPIGYFGASTGAAAALVAAARQPEGIAAIVSRGGRPDLAGSELERVKAPTLLIVGGDDIPVIELNEQAYRKLRVPKSLEIVAGATHLFEEPGKLEEVSRLAGNWFGQWMGRTGARDS